MHHVNLLKASFSINKYFEFLCEAYSSEEKFENRTLTTTRHLLVYIIPTEYSKSVRRFYTSIFREARFDVANTGEHQIFVFFIQYLYVFVHFSLFSRIRP